MSEKIRVKIFATEFPRMQSFAVSQGSQIPIELELDDYTIPANAKIVAYVRGRYASTTYKANCSFEGNVITLVPPSGFFVPGPNALQVEINGTVIPFQIDAICKARVSDIGNPTTPETVLPYVERAEAAAQAAEKSKNAAETSAQNAVNSASSAAKSAQNAAKSAADANAIFIKTGKLTVRTPYIGENNHWFIWSLSQETFVDSGVDSRGDAPSLNGYATAYQIASSGITVPTGEWLQERPVTPQGQYLWTRITATFETGNVTWYTVDYRAIDGEQSVASEIGLRVVDGALCQVFIG